MIDIVSPGDGEYAQIFCFRIDMVGSELVLKNTSPGKPGRGKQRISLSKMNMHKHILYVLTDMVKQVTIWVPHQKSPNMPLRKDRLPVSSRIMMDHLVSYGKKFPEAAAEYAPHIVIRSIRNALRMTQAQLAKRAGMPQSHLAKIETGKVDVQLSTLRRILRAMYCEVVVLPKFLKSPQAALAERVKEVARRRVARVAGSMALEKQPPEEKMTRALMRSEEERMMRNPSTEIWDEPWATEGASVVRDQPQVAADRSHMPVRIVEKEDDRDALRFWLAQPPKARIDAMEFLRRQMYLITGNKILPHLERSIQLRDLHS